MAHAVSYEKKCEPLFKRQVRALQGLHLRVDKTAELGCPAMHMLQYTLRAACSQSKTTDAQHVCAVELSRETRQENEHLIIGFK